MTNKCCVMFIAVSFFVGLAAFAHADDYLDYEAVAEMHRAAYDSISSASLVFVYDRTGWVPIRREVAYDAKTRQCIYHEEPVDPADLDDPSQAYEGRITHSYNKKTMRLVSNGQFTMHSEGTSPATIEKYNDMDSALHRSPPFYGLIPEHILKGDPKKVNSSVETENGAEVVVFDLSMIYGVNYKIKCDPNASYKILELEHTKDGVPVARNLARYYHSVDGVHYPRFYSDTNYEKDGEISSLSMSILLSAQFNKPLSPGIFELDIPEETEMLEIRPKIRNHRPEVMQTIGKHRRGSERYYRNTGSDRDD